METIPNAEAVTVDKLFVLAALECAGPDLDGIHVHAHDGELRVVGVDIGRRLLIGSMALPKKAPRWLKDGVTIAGKGMKARLGLIDGGNVVIEWAPGLAKAVVRDEADNDRFRLAVIDKPFPDYVQLVGAMEVDGSVSAEPIGLNSVYLKSVAGLANIFKDLLPDNVKKQKTGMPIRAIPTTSDRPVWFTFDYVPGLALCQMPVPQAGAVDPQTVRLMAPAVRGTLAALKANRTRTEEWAKAATDDDERDRYLTKVQEYTARIDAIMASMKTALPAPEPQHPAPAMPQPEAKAEPVKPAASPAKPAAKPVTYTPGKHRHGHQTGRKH